MSRTGRAAGLAAVLLALCIAGCGRGPSDALVIVTPWTDAEQRATEAAFRDWTAAQGEKARPIRWVRLAPGVGLSQVVGRHLRADVILGGPGAEYARLAVLGQLADSPGPGQPAWCMAKRVRAGLAVDRTALAAQAVRVPPGGLGLSGQALRGRVALADPRCDGAGLAVVKARLSAGPWPEGYAELVRTFGNARSVGRVRGSALASLERGEATVAPVEAKVEGFEFLPIAGGPHDDLTEGAAIPTGAAHPEAARAFLRFLADREPQPASPGDNAPADAILADLLGATLVDAQDELRAARTNLMRLAPGRRAEYEGWLTEAPPWPPASVERLLATTNAARWTETLAEQLSPDPASRAWLLASWRSVSKPIDGAALADLARAVDGRLAAEPRFRAWLRAEWTAWARQRYRAAGRAASASPEGPRS